jgi:ABC-type sugar transport system permease subunit
LTPAQPGIAARLWRARLSYIYLAPTFALVLLFQYYPPIAGLYRSFFAWSANLETFVGLDNYRELLADEIVRVSFGNMLQLTAFHIFQNLGAPLLAAELLFHMRDRRWSYAYQLVIIVPLVVPTVLTLLIWQFVYDPAVGPLNAFLHLVGLGEVASPWLHSSRTALYALMFVGFPWLNPIAVFIFLAGLMNIDENVFEAARLDGSEGLHRFVRIDLPLIMSQVKLLIMLSVIGGAVGNFGAQLVLTGGGPGNSTQVPGFYMYTQAFAFNRMGYASAIGVVLFVVTLAVTLFNWKVIRPSLEQAER